VVRPKDAKGLRLLADPGREFHAVDLKAAEGEDCDPTTDTRQISVSATSARDPSRLSEPECTHLLEMEVIMRRGVAERVTQPVRNREARVAGPHLA
jgi:hypothetical protein